MVPSPRWWSRGAICAIASLAVAYLGACAPPDGDEETGDHDDHEHEDPEPTESSSEALESGSVLKAATDGCSTLAVKGLSLQIIEEANCVEPGAYAELPQRSNLVVKAPVFPYLEAPARAKLVAALDANPQKTMTINSMLRTIPQQYMLYRWMQQGRCGIGLAARPGNSNHETGLAIDISEYSSWKSALTSRGFSWLGSKDPVHFDYRGQGAVDHRGLDVLAFQRLWNRNHPDDRISEDGDYGPQTESRIKQAPAAGFPVGASCGAEADEPAPEEAAPPTDDAAPPDDGAPAECAHVELCQGVALDANCSACAGEVCRVDEYCCTVDWDVACVATAEDLCF